MPPCFIPLSTFSTSLRPLRLRFPTCRRAPSYRPICATSTSPTPTTSSSLTPSRWRVRTIQQAPEEDVLGRILMVKGWVRSVRDQKAFAFVDLNDGSSLKGLQIVIPASSPAYQVVADLSTGCAVAATGEVVKSEGKGQNVELRAKEVVVVGNAGDDYPLQKKRHTLEFLRGIAHLRARTNSMGAMARVRSALAFASHEYFTGLGFVYLNAPIITASDCEGAGEMFRVTTLLEEDGGVKTNDKGKVDFNKDFFGKAAYLTVSGQLSGETYATALGDIYTFGPTFRAENSNTSRHLAEFWMIEPEMAFASLADCMANAEGFVKHVVGKVLERCSADLEFFDRFVQKGLLEKLRLVANEPFARISYTEAIELLIKANKANKKGKKRFEFAVEWGCDLQSEHERWLAEEHFKRPVFVYNYPSGIKAFYMRGNDEDEGKTVQAMDLLVPGIGELIGGSAREERLDVLEKKIEINGLDKDAYWWYLDLRRYGSVPHAGYGLGFERLIQFVTGLENIRDVIPYPRYPGSAEF